MTDTVLEAKTVSVTVAASVVLMTSTVVVGRSTVAGSITVVDKITPSTVVVGASVANAPRPTLGPMSFGVLLGLDGFGVVRFLLFPVGPGFLVLLGLLAPLMAAAGTVFLGAFLVVLRFLLLLLAAATFLALDAMFAGLLLLPRGSRRCWSMFMCMSIGAAREELAS